MYRSKMEARSKMISLNFSRLKDRLCRGMTGGKIIGKTIMEIFIT